MNANVHRNETATLPQGWSWANSGDLFSFVTSGSRGWADYYSDAGPLFLRIGNLEHSSISLDLKSVQRVQPPPGAEGIRTRVQPGDLLISITADVGMVAIAPDKLGEAFINQHVALARPVDGLSNRYLAWFLTSPAGKEQLRRLQKGATKLGLGLDAIKGVKIPLAPRAEQDRIVASIEERVAQLNIAVAALKRARGNLKRYRASVLKAACEGHLVPTEAELARTDGRDYEPASELLERSLRERQARWEEERLAKMKAAGKAPKGDERKTVYEEPASADIQVLPPLPKGWSWATAHQLSSSEPNAITDGPFGSNLKTAHYTTEGPRVVRLQNIGEGVFLDEQAHISSDHFEKLSKHRVFAGDIVIAALGEELPRACMVPESLGPAIVKADCIRMKPNPRLCLPQYLLIALNSEPTRRRTAKIIHGVGRPRMNLGEIKAIAIPLPPLAEQVRIAAEVDRRLSLAEEAGKSARMDLARAENLRRSILKQAFEGRLLPQHPDDEPASALLERIRQLRASSPPVPSTPKQMALRLEEPKRPRTSRRRSASS